MPLPMQWTLFWCGLVIAADSAVGGLAAVLFGKHAVPTNAIGWTFSLVGGGFLLWKLHKIEIGEES